MSRDRDGFDSLLDSADYGDYGTDGYPDDDYDPAGLDYDPAGYADDDGFGPEHRPGRNGRSDGRSGRDAGRDAGRRPGRAFTKLSLVLVVVAVMVGAGIYGVGQVIGRFGGEPAADYTGGGDGIVVIKVPDGATSSQIGATLAEAEVIASRQAFVNLASRDSRALSIQPGTYQLRSRMSAAAALDALLDGQSSALFRYTISPGDTVRKVFRELSSRTGIPFEQLEPIARDKARQTELGLPAYAPGLEGYLYPSTYDVGPGTDPVEVIREAIARFNAHAEKIDLLRRAEAGSMRPDEIVTIASIIEKEVANAAEGPKVARVIYNRLNDESGRYRRIDMDSTTRYALDEYQGSLTVEQLRDNNPYNTRAVAGLPPGAIANPGDWALESALSPAQGSWLYFISMPRSGDTRFASNEAEFAQLQAEYRGQGGTE